MNKNNPKNVLELRRKWAEAVVRALVKSGKFDYPAGQPKTAITLLYKKSRISVYISFDPARLISIQIELTLDGYKKPSGKYIAGKQKIIITLKENEPVNIVSQLKTGESRLAVRILADILDVLTEVDRALTKTRGYFLAIWRK